MCSLPRSPELWGSRARWASPALLPARPPTRKAATSRHPERTTLPRWGPAGGGKGGRCHTDACTRLGKVVGLYLHLQAGWAPLPGAGRHRRHHLTSATRDTTEHEPTNSYPKSVTGQKMGIVHGSVGVGHFDNTKTLRRLRECFHWSTADVTWSSTYTAATPARHRRGLAKPHMLPYRGT